MVLSYINLGLIFIFGTALGSFLNLVSDRVVKGGKIVADHSWYHPFSEVLAGLFLVLAATLSKFSFFEPFSVSTLVGFLFLAVVFSFFEILLLTDLKYLLVPDKIVVPAIIFVALFNLSTTVINLYEYRDRLQNDDFGRYLLKAGFFESQVETAVRSLGFNFVSAIAIALFFFFIVWVTRGRGMGGGDIS